MNKTTVSNKLSHKLAQLQLLGHYNPSLMYLAVLILLEK